MIITTDAEKSFDKIQLPFMVKTLQRVGREETYLNIIKTIYDKPTSNVIFNSEKLKAFPLRAVTRQLNTTFFFFFFTTFIKHSFRSPIHSNQRRKTNKGNPIGKEEVKLLVFADDVILYIENP